MAFPDWQPAEERGEDAQSLPSLRPGETVRLREAKGIGTPATRAEIIRGLRAQALLASEGKHIVPTERGLALFGILERADPALVDPGVTDQLERLLDEVLVGRQAMMGAINVVCAQAQRIIGRLTEKGRAGTAPLVGLTKSTEGAARPPTPAQLAFAGRIAEERGLAVPEEARATSASLSASDRRASRTRAAAKAGRGPEKRAGQDAEGSRRAGHGHERAADGIAHARGAAGRDPIAHSVRQQGGGPAARGPLSRREMVRTSGHRSRAVS